MNPWNKYIKKTKTKNIGITDLQRFIANYQIFLLNLFANKNKSHNQSGYHQKIDQKEKKDKEEKFKRRKKLKKLWSEKRKINGIKMYEIRISDNTQNTNWRI